FIKTWWSLISKIIESRTIDFRHFWLNDNETALDMWALGCILKELLSHKPLLPDKTEIGQLEPIKPDFPKMPAIQNFTLKQQLYNNLKPKFQYLSAAEGMATLKLLFTKIPIKTEKQALKTLRPRIMEKFHRISPLYGGPKSYEKEKKLVGDFGAKIEAIATDVESMKDHYNGISEKQENLQTVFNNLKAIGY
uniref:Protein kinase domain-containing protein n=1 Tax=Glossina palpalis gambiensis TaxID=67801 RepID=A0A1B0BRM5_9MUSC